MEFTLSQVGRGFARAFSSHSRPYELRSQLRKAIFGFVNCHNLHRYHQALDDVTPADVLYSRREQILQ
jgi:transposase InsO family protein